MGLVIEDEDMAVEARSGSFRIYGNPGEIVELDWCDLLPLKRLLDRLLEMRQADEA